MKPECNCGRTGDLESLCSLTAIEREFCLPYFLLRYPGHDLAQNGTAIRAAKQVRGLADKGDGDCARRFSVFRPMPLDFFFDENGEYVRPRRVNRRRGAP